MMRGETNMDLIYYDEENTEFIRAKYLEMLKIVTELEEKFAGRHFTLDGHLIGSIGEVMASYHYGIGLYKASKKEHDGKVDGREVQIKITQQDSIMISGKPEYLIVLYLTRSGEVYEVYNGPGKKPWETATIRKGHSSRMMRVNKLMKLDSEIISVEDRIKIKKPAIEKMRKEFTNR